MEKFYLEEPCIKRKGGNIGYWILDIRYSIRPTER